MKLKKFDGDRMKVFNDIETCESEEEYNLRIIKEGEYIHSDHCEDHKIILLMESKE